MSIEEKLLKIEQLVNEIRIEINNPIPKQSKASQEEQVADILISDSAVKPGEYKQVHRNQPATPSGQARFGTAKLIRR